MAKPCITSWIFMNYLIIDKQFLILCKFIIIGSDILFNRLCLFRRVCRLFGGFSARFTDLGANKCMPDRQFIRLHLNLCRQNTFHSANIFLYFFFHQGDVTLRFSWSNPLGFESPCPHQITSCIFVLENAAFGISETKIIAKRGA